MRLSIIIPSLNRAAYLGGAIESVLGGGLPGIECVVVDGGSSDGSVDLLAEAKRRHGEALAYVSEPDAGPSDAYNKGVGMARGEVLGCIGADDEVAEGAVGFVLERFEQHPEYALIYGECEVMDAAGSTIGRYAVKDFSLEVQLNEGCCVQFPSCYYRREVVDRVGFMDTEDVYGDLDWLARAAQHYAFHRVDRTLSRFRLHQGGLTGSTLNSDLPEALFRLNRKYGGRLFSTVGRRWLRRRLGRFPLYARHVERRLERMDWRRVPEGGSCYIFGAALTGYACWQSLRGSGRRVLGFADNFPPREGIYCELPVKRPQELLREGGGKDGIVIATGGYPFAIRRQLRRLGWRGPIYSFSAGGR